MRHAKTFISFSCILLNKPTDDVRLRNIVHRRIMQKLIRTLEKLCIQQGNNSKHEWRYLSLGKFRKIRENLWEVKELGYV